MDSVPVRGIDEVTTYCISSCKESLITPVAKEIACHSIKSEGTELNKEKGRIVIVTEP